ncbi:hypothetical protein [Flavobacterium sp. CS20]|uniref:hypothetical protein n=1 Tax=Flavobacterium sp. CS20 TaxID=2775246 RepID=UPI001B3A7567|nr:hypothetical protein [Flavobacterium sp. CS20]QTY27909.1 hypothetical protein IGB25_05230 [Flavobacterium sp. CS20]
MKKTFVIIIFLFAFSESSKAQDYFYEKSFNLLSDMLEGKEVLDFKNAVFSVENAYLKGRLDTIILNNEISMLSSLAKKIQSERNLTYDGRDKSKVEKYASLFSIMNDSIKVQDQDGKIFYYIPFAYDFEDPFGHEDWKSMFVTELLRTKKGNCHSLPYLYKILAEELGVDAHLALAPNHVYIKHKSEKDGWYNTELTSGIFPIDAWLMASGYIHIDAIRNGVYMKALTDKESIALCLVDLAQGYQRQEFYDLDFVIKCADKALEYFPNYVNAMILKTEVKGKKIENLLYEKNTNFSDVNKYPETRKILLNIQNELGVIHELGYRQMPEDMYLNWLVSLKEEREKYSNKKINTFNNKTN